MLIFTGCIRTIIFSSHRTEKNTFYWFDGSSVLRFILQGFRDFCSVLLHSAPFRGIYPTYAIITAFWFYAYRDDAARRAWHFYLCLSVRHRRAYTEGKGLFEVFTHGLDLACIIICFTSIDGPAHRAGTNASNIYASYMCCVIVNYFLVIAEKETYYGITSEKPKQS